MSEWDHISTAPRDGTEIELTWFDDGKPAEIYPMRWNRFASNPPFVNSRGCWAMHSRTTNEILLTWSEEDPDGAPTHWRPLEKRKPALADATPKSNPRGQ